MSWFKRAFFAISEGMVLAAYFQANRPELEALVTSNPVLAPLYESLDRIWRVLKNGEKPKDL